ncbi:MAG: DUF2380 domain-containing protein [Thiothrix sp.]|nr:MAG: DUF2380 domain-containing protein [Thiothrix sp.]
MPTSLSFKPWLFGLLFALFYLQALNLSANSAVPSRIAVLGFELHDFTQLPIPSAELARTEAAQTILAEALQTAGYIVVPNNQPLQTQANQGFGYLVAHPDKAAELGKALQADYVLVGRVQKPSYLFAYLMVQVIEVKTGQQLAEFSREAKGETVGATRRALLQIATEIPKALDKASSNNQEAKLNFIAPIYQKNTSKDFDTVIDDLLFAISQHNFRLTEQSTIGQAIAEREEKNFPKITILHFCNLTYAQALLEKAIASPLHMPCRISVRQVNNQVLIETLLLPNNAAEQAFVDEINQILQEIVNTGAA